jgi:hypothetical protein
MAINTYPAIASPVKSVQRGSAGGAGTVTITAIDITKSMINVFGTASSGTVSASFNMNMNAGSMTFITATGNHSPNFGAANTQPSTGFVAWVGENNTANSVYFNQSATVNAGSASVGAGSTNLVSAVVQGYLSGSTSLVVSGACRWEVVEFN